jgi:uncharacterized metal-binding protein
MGPLGGLWISLWWPYAWLIKHRSPISHAPILGTVVRLLYTWGIVLAANLFLGFSVDWVAFWTHPVAIGTVWGLLVSDVAHWWMDVRSSRRKRQASRKKREVWRWAREGDS